MLRTLCRRLTCPTKYQSQTKAIRAFAGGPSHDVSHAPKDSHEVSKSKDSHHDVDHGHGDHGHGEHGHGPVPLKIPEYEAFNKIVINEQIQQHYEKLGSVSGPQLEQEISRVTDLLAAEADKVDAESPPIAIWEMLASKTFLKCLAEINTTELKNPKLNAKQLLTVYKEQKAEFDKIATPALRNEGVSPFLIEYLADFYKRRTRIPLFELENSLEQYKVLLLRYPKIEKMRDVSTEKETYSSKLYQLNSVGIQAWREIRDTPIQNEDKQKRNVNRFRGWLALTKAFQRGLTDTEYNHLLTVLQPHVEKEELNKILFEQASVIKQVKDIDPDKAEELLTEALEAFPNANEHRQYLLDKLVGDEAPGSSVEPEEQGLIVRSPLLTPYSGQQSKEALNVQELKTSFDVAIASSNDDAGNLSFLQRAKNRFMSILTPALERKIDILGMIKSAQLSEKELDTLLSTFIRDDDGFDLNLLNDAINPGTLSAKLWGNRIMMDAIPAVEYTKEYHDFPSKGFSQNANEPRSQQALDELTKEYDFGPLIAPFATGFDELYHHKLLRLATEYYNFDLASEVGYLQFDMFLHAYEVSPGEDNLDRVHPTPVPHHTYEELPIIKYDGYDESDDPEIYKLSEGQKSGGHH